MLAVLLFTLCFAACFLRLFFLKIYAQIAHSVLFAACITAMHQKSAIFHDHGLEGVPPLHKVHRLVTAKAILIKNLVSFAVLSGFGWIHFRINFSPSSGKSASASRAVD